MSFFFAFVALQVARGQCICSRFDQPFGGLALPKTNSREGPTMMGIFFEKVTGPFKKWQWSHFWYQFVRFLGCTSFLQAVENLTVLRPRKQPLPPGGFSSKPGEYAACQHGERKGAIWSWGASEIPAYEGG